MQQFWGASPTEAERMNNLYKDLRIAEEYDNPMMISQLKREIELENLSIQLFNALN